MELGALMRWHLFLALFFCITATAMVALGQEDNLTIALDRNAYSAVEGDSVQICVTYITGDIPSTQDVQIDFSSPISKSLPTHLRLFLGHTN